MIINTEQLLFIMENTPCDQNIMLVGKHGIGKSQILENFYAAKNCRVVTLFLGQMSDPGDLIGLPEKNEKTGKTDFMLPYWFPLDDEPVVLFLDELNRARPEVLQTIMDLTLNRKLAGKTLPKGSRIISAVNNGNEYQLTDLDPALVSRFNIYEFAPSVEDWLMWAEKTGLDLRIISFIRENPEFLDSGEDDFSAENLERTPDRRSWVRTSNIIKNFENLSDLHKPIVSGIIGNKATAAFFAFVNEHKIPSAKSVLLDFENCTKDLKELQPVDLTRVNSSLFRFVESKVYDSEKKSEIISNLEKYFDFAGKNCSREVQSHFVSLINAKTFPETLFLIVEENKSFYQKLTDFVMD